MTLFTVDRAEGIGTIILTMLIAFIVVWTRWGDFAPHSVVFKRINVAVDGSPASELPLGHANEQARQNAAALTGIFIIDGQWADLSAMTGNHPRTRASCPLLLP